MTDLVQNARMFAIGAHSAKGHKYAEGPYHHHPIAVSMIVADVCTSPHVIAAALLHDVVEMTEITVAQIQEEFGVLVARLVYEVTDVLADGNRSTRKAMDSDKLSLASPEGKTIKLADILDNGATIMHRNPEFGRMWMPEKRLLLPVLRGGNHALWQRAANLLGLEFPA